MNRKANQNDKQLDAAEDHAMKNEQRREDQLVMKYHEGSGIGTQKQISEINGEVSNQEIQRKRSKSRKFSANYSHTSEARNRKFSDKDFSLRDKEQELSLNFTNQMDTSKKELSEIEFGINIPKISKLISQKLENVVTKIRQQKRNTSQSISDSIKVTHSYGNEPSNSRQDSPHYQSSLENEQPSNLRANSNSNEILIDDFFGEEEEKERSHAEFSQNYRSQNESSNILENHSSFQYPEIKEEADDDEEYAKPMGSLTIKQYQQKHEEAIKKNIKEKLGKKYKKQTHTRKPSSTLRQKYSDFLKKNHQDIDKLYDNIRKDIRKNNRKIHQIRSKDPILILEGDINDANSEQDQIFNQQIIQHYQQHIVAQNQNMSSEDLIRYFRYLLQNARALYIKHLNKSK